MLRLVFMLSISKTISCLIKKVVAWFITQWFIISTTLSQGYAGSCTGFYLHNRGQNVESWMNILVLKTGNCKTTRT